MLLNKATPIYFREKMAKESFEIAYGLMAERNFGLTYKVFFLFLRGPIQLSSFKK